MNRRELLILALCLIAVFAIVFARFSGPESANALDIRSVQSSTRTTLPAGAFSLEPTTAPSTRPTTAPVEDGDPILIPELKSLVLLDSTDKVVESPAYLAPIVVNGPKLAMDRELQRKLSQFIGQPLRWSDVLKIRQVIAIEYNRMGRPVMEAITPEQDITHGVLQLVILEGKVGRIILEGNREFSTELLGGRIRLRPGDVIEHDKLLADIDALNRNPYRNVSVEYVRGKNPGQTDLIFRVYEQTPVRTYASYDNTGSEATGYNRYTFGFNYGNLFGLDQQINYQITTGDDINKIQAHNLSWTIPLAWRHELVLGWSLSLSRPTVEREGFDLQGVNYGANAKYVIPFRREPWLQHQMSVEFEFERSNNNLDNGGNTVFDRSTDLVTFSIGYDGTITDKWGRTRFATTAVFSPGGLTSYNDDDHFQEVRVGADATYGVLRVNLDRATRLPWNLQLVNRFSGQIASGALLGSEQIGIGGARSVRGFPERAGNGDAGFFISSELQFPGFSPADAFFGGRFRDQLQFVAFVDYGIAYNLDLGDTSDARANPRRSAFAAFGPGIRYSVSPYLNVTYDYGIRLSDFGDGKSSGHHVWVNFSYQW